MSFDISDRERLTRRADCAFWLHLLAAPLIVHSVVSLVSEPLAGVVGRAPAPRAHARHDRRSGHRDRRGRRRSWRSWPCSSTAGPCWSPASPTSAAPSPTRWRSSGSGSDPSFVISGTLVILGAFVLIAGNRLGAAAPAPARPRHSGDRQPPAAGARHAHDEPRASSRSSRRRPATAFDPVGPADLPMLRRWLEMPHMREWWGDPETEIGYIRDMIEGRDTTRPFIFSVDGEPVGYIQYWFLGDYQNASWIDGPSLARRAAVRRGGGRPVDRRSGAALAGDRLGRPAGLCRSDWQAKDTVPSSSTPMWPTRAPCAPI